MSRTTSHFIPPYLLDQIAAAPDEELARCGHLTRELDAVLRATRSATAGPPVSTSGAAWEIYNAANGSALPGALVRSPDDAASGDVAVDEAAVGVTETLALFADLGRSSYDGEGATVVATVHYEKDYDNAFWDGRQLVFGDGDGKIFERFTKPVDVLAHELAHAVTQYTANLTYSGQPGALNESLSDVFGSCVKQRVLGQGAAEADWLIGEGIFKPGINGAALRSMKAPGTAYDDPTLGKDPQVGSMDGYVQTQDDNGGVHLNSGIPNRAFQLAATAIGGTSWEGAGRVWFAALTSGLAPATDFAAFAAACVGASGEHAQKVQAAWDAVGVGASTRAPAAPAAPVANLVEVTRSGGFAGQVARGSLDLTSDDPRAPEAASLLQLIDFNGIREGAAGADRYVYDFHRDPHRIRVHEAALTDELRRLAELLLS